MFDMSIVLYEYTEILLGKRKNYSDTFFRQGPDDEKHAIEFIRTIARSLLRCRTLEAAHQSISPEIMETLKLDKILSVISVPKSVHREDRQTYLIDKIFSTDFNEEKWIAEHLCERIIKGKLKKFPKYYMNEELGFRRARFCLHYLLNREMPEKTIPQLYQVSITPAFRIFLKERLLLNVCLRIFDLPVEFVHDAIDDEYQDPPFFKMYRMISRLDPEGRYALQFSTDDAE